MNWAQQPSDWRDGGGHRKGEQRIQEWGERGRGFDKSRIASTPAQTVVGKVALGANVKKESGLTRKGDTQRNKGKRCKKGGRFECDEKTEGDRNSSVGEEKEGFFGLGKCGKVLG